MIRRDIRYTFDSANNHCIHNSATNRVFSVIGTIQAPGSPNKPLDGRTFYATTNPMKTEEFRSLVWAGNATAPLIQFHRRDELLKLL